MCSDLASANQAGSIPNFRENSATLVKTKEIKIINQGILQTGGIYVVVWVGRGCNCFKYVVQQFCGIRI